VYYSVAMPFIDWSDSEGMFGLLVDFVADARTECQRDAERRQFLSDLLDRLHGLTRQSGSISGRDAAKRLRTIYHSIDPEFKDDPVSTHVKDCIVELERAND
jgi:hypothetical protein